MDSALTGSANILAGPVALALGLVFIVTGATCSTLLLRPKSRLDAVIAFGVVAPAGVAAAMLAAGIPGLLQPATLLILLGSWALLGLAAARRWSGRGARIRWTGVFADWKQHPWTIALVLLAGLSLAWQVVVALVLPPYAYDALTYHLTTVAVWVQSGSLRPSPFSRCCAFYPFTPELLVGFPVVLLHDNSLVGLVQVPFVLLGAAATAGIARIVGLARSSAAAAGALFALTPVVLAQAPTNYVDLTLAALVLSALYALTRYAETGAAQQLLVAGLAAGLVLGTKGIGPLWAIALFAAAIAASVIAVRTGRARPASAIKGLAGGAFAGAVVGGWWYIRNLATTGNPLYPFTVRLFGKTLFNGPIDVGETLTVPPVGANAPWPVTVALNWASDLKFWNQGSIDYQQRFGGLGPLWVWLGLPLLAVMVALLVRRRSLALIPVTVVLIVFLLQPYKWWARFTLPLAALGCIAIAWAIARAPWPWLRVALRTSALVLATAGVYLTTHAVDPQAGAADIPSTEVVDLIGKPQEDRSLGRLVHQEYAFLDEIPEDATIVVDLDATPVRFVSPLFGERFSRRILPADSGHVPSDGWLVTSLGRPLDAAAGAAHVLIWDVRGIRVWRPKTPSDPPSAAVPPAT